MQVTRWLGEGRMVRWIGATAAALLLAGCGGDDPSADVLPTEISPSGDRLEAEVRRTTNGVPHIEADTVEEVSMGAGYVQAQDNVCLIAEQLVRAQGNRAKFFGPGDNDINIIEDFSVRALQIPQLAEARFGELSAVSEAGIRGFAAGFNEFLAEVEAGDAQLPPRCRGEPWVRQFAPEEFFAYYRFLAQRASGFQFIDGPLFEAVPPGESTAPTVVSGSSGAISTQGIADNARRMSREREAIVDFNGGSNGWGIGGEMTESGRGGLLANPHFPYNGPGRFYQMHVTVPGVVDFNGAGLIGVPTPQIGFNEHLAWTHTVSASDRFTGYELELKSGTGEGALTYMKDGEEVDIEQRTVQIEVADGNGGTMTLERTFYLSEQGPMVSLNAINSLLPQWGDSGIINDGPAAFTYRDANENATGAIDTWFRMARASNLEEFRDVFRDCGSTLWVNTMYADREGNAFYVDSSSVPALSQEAEQALRERRESSGLVELLFASQFPLLDGSESRDDWQDTACKDRVRFEDMPKMRRDDFVQNSNDSYWATNPAQFLTGFSQLYGPEESQISARTRLGLTMVQNPGQSGLADTAPAGPDEEFDARELIDTIHNNRAFRAEQFLDNVRNRCDMLGDQQEVNLPGGDGSRTVTEGCQALDQWDGVYNTDSRGAHVFRLLMGNYNQSLPDDLTVAFDPADPVNTPRDPTDPDPDNLENDPMLQSLARALEILDSVGIAADARLGDVQRYQLSGGAPPGGTPEEIGSSLPWHGGNAGLEGAFNLVQPSGGTELAEQTLFPIVQPAQDVGDGFDSDTGRMSSEGWRVLEGTSWHFGLMFTDDGPEAYGLLSYSQSNQSTSPFRLDQSERFSNKNPRPLLFTDQEIEANKISETRLILDR